MHENNIKVFHIIPCLDRGGAERVAIDLIINASPYAEGLLVSLKKPRSGGEILEKELLRHGKKLKVIGQRHQADIVALIKLYFFFRNEKPDVVHTHLFGGDLYGRLAARLARVPVVISTEHNFNITEGSFRKLIKKITARLSSLIIAVSKGVADNTIRTEGALPSRTRVIYNGIKTKEFNTHDGEFHNPLVVGCLGRLSQQKNHQELVTALSLVNPNIKCLIAGEGELKSDLLGQIEGLQLSSHVRLVGQQDDINKFFSEIDVFILPSLSEGLPLVLLEAGAAGLPVIASDISSNKEIIEHGKTGYLYNSGKPEELAEALVFMRENPDKAKVFGIALLAHVKKEFDVSLMVEKYEAVYKELLSNYYENTPS